MSRIKKRGLDYFPIDIDFMQNRLVRRIMKREGEGSLATLFGALYCIYGREGYAHASTESEVENATSKGANVTIKPENVTYGTHSTAQNRKTPPQQFPRRGNSERGRNVRRGKGGGIYFF